MKFLAQLTTLLYYAIKKGTFSDKVSAFVIGAIINFPFTQIIEKYIFNDWDMLGYVIVLLAVDTVSGVIKHWNNNNLSPEGFRKFFIKVTVAFSALITSHVMHSIALERGSESVGNHLDTLIYSGIGVWIGLSIGQNFYDLTNGKFPPRFLMRHLKFFEKTGKISSYNEKEVSSSKDKNEKN